MIILGSSGCGKTTLLRIMAGLLQPQSGTIQKNSESALCEESYEKKSAFVFQEPRLLPWLTVLENVLLPIKNKKKFLHTSSTLFSLSLKEAKERAYHFLDLVSLKDKALSLPGTLSGGQAQRVSIARAFCYPSSFLFMDEPFQSLDLPLRAHLMEMVLALLKKEPRLLVAVTHDPREAVFLGKRIIILGNGNDDDNKEGVCKIIFDEKNDNEAGDLLQAEHRIINIMRFGAN